MRFVQQHASWLLFGFAVLVGGIWKFTPELTNYVYRTEGYKLLYQALEVLGDENSEPDFCVARGVTDPQALNLVVQAVDALEKGREAKPADAQTLLLLGRAYCLAGRLEEAIAAYEGYSALRPESPLGWLEGGFAYEELCISLSSASINSSITELDWPRCNDVQLVEKVLTQWELGEISAQNALEKGIEAKKLRHYEEAFIWYERANLMMPTWGHPFLQSGIVYNLLNNWQLAEIALKKAIELEPENKDIYFYLGLTFEGEQAWEQALQNYQIALEKKSGEIGTSVIAFRIGWIHQNQLQPKDIEGALKAYEDAFAFNDFDYSWQKANVYYQRGIIYTWGEKWLEAISEFQNTLALSPQHYWARVSLANAFWKTGDLIRGKGFANQAIDLEPDQGQGYLLLAEILLSEGDIDGARTIYEKLLEKDPHNHEAIEQLNKLSQ